MFVYLDDGLNGSPGTLIDSIPMPGGSFTPASYVTSFLPTPTQIDSNGFYVLWDMRGAGVTLGTNINVPYCNRGWEVLGGTWSPYRNSETEDLMIRATIERTGVGIAENELNQQLGNFYPNPANSTATINIDSRLLNDGNLQISLFDLEGRAIEGRILSNGSNQLTLETDKLSQGLYTVRFTNGSTVAARKISVVH